MLPLLLALLLAAPERAGSLEGRVLRHDGTPAANGMVVALPRNEAVVRTFEAKTDAEGRYRFDSLAPGVYTLLFETASAGSLVPDFTDVILESTMRGVTRTLRAATSPHVVAVEEGAAARHDIRLPPMALPRGRATSGGKPVVGLRIVLSRIGEGDSPTFETFEAPPTDATGAFESEPVPVGRYLVRGYRDSLHYALGRAEFKAPGPADLPVPLGERTLKLAIADADGKPVAPVSCSIEAAGPAHGGFRAGFDRSGDAPEGDEIPWLLPGTYRLEVAAGEVAIEPMEFAIGAEDLALRIALPPAGFLEVKVLDKAGAPVADEAVVLYRADGTAKAAHYSDEMGRVRIALPCGKWRVGLLSAPESKELEIRRGGTTGVELVAARPPPPEPPAPPK